MKKLITNGILLLVTGMSFGQIDDNLTKDSWKIGKEKIIYGNTIFRLEGKNDTGGSTNVGYQTFDQIKSRLTKKAEQEMWTEEKKQKLFGAYDRLAQGGEVHLYITRLTIEAANTEMFTVIVKDSTEKEIYRKELKSDIPETPSGGNYWWNYVTVPISEKVGNTFFIYVIDRIGGDNGRFKFQVKR